MSMYLMSEDGTVFCIHYHESEHVFGARPMHIFKGIAIDDGTGFGLFNKSSFEIKKVHFNDPATIVLWADGTKTVVKCGEEDIYDPQTGLLMCIAKKAFGNTGKFNDVLREWIPERGCTYMGDVIDYLLNPLESFANMLNANLVKEDDANAGD